MAEGGLGFTRGFTKTKQQEKWLNYKAFEAGESFPGSDNLKYYTSI